MQTWTYHGFRSIKLIWYLKTFQRSASLYCSWSSQTLWLSPIWIHNFRCHPQQVLFQLRTLFLISNVPYSIAGDYSAVLNDRLSAIHSTQTEKCSMKNCLGEIVSLGLIFETESCYRERKRSGGSGESGIGFSRWTYFIERH